MTIEHETVRETDNGEVGAGVLDRITAAGVFLRNPGEIENFLFDHAALQNILPDIIHDAAKRLGEDGQLALEVDVSAGLGNEYLVLLLRSHAYDSTILELSRDLTTRARTLMPVPDRHSIVTTDFVHLS